MMRNVERNLRKLHMFEDRTQNYSSGCSHQEAAENVKGEVSFSHRQYQKSVSIKVLP